MCMYNVCVYMYACVHVLCVSTYMCVCLCMHGRRNRSGRSGGRRTNTFLKKKKKKKKKSLANMGMGTGDVDPPFRLTCYDNVYNNNDIYVHRLKRNGFHSLDIIVRSFFFCVCHLSRRFPFPKRSFGSKGETRSFRAEPVV